ncbi:MAG: hypothetical protein M1835_006781 [Candelina submexicana]|nr:MAG: hypothetical protein M1835_006781 [Candelina submexicana]
MYDLVGSGQEYIDWSIRENWSSYWCPYHTKEESSDWPTAAAKPEFVRVSLRKDGPWVDHHGNLEALAGFGGAQAKSFMMQQSSFQRTFEHMANNESLLLLSSGSEPRTLFSTGLKFGRDSDSSLLRKLSLAYLGWPSVSQNAQVQSDISLSSYRTAPSKLSAMPSYVSAMTSSSQCTSFKNGKQVLELDPTLKDTVVGKLAMQYSRFITDRGLLETLENELNWSGEGQHVMYPSTSIPPLDSIATLGCSLTPSVDKVRCRRIHLARKTMSCSAKVRMDSVMTEVALLQRLRHNHIIQLVGSYLRGRSFSILLYPAVEYNLAQYMEGYWTDTHRRSLERFFRCLVHALNYIHQAGIKHMDIKPKNILVKSGRGGVPGDPSEIDPRVYIGDFGISREFPPQDTSQTDGPTARSPVYCAPEVKNYNISGDSRGRAADVFSMGCVFLEMVTILLNKSLDVFIEHRSDGSNEDGSFCGNLNLVASWMLILREASRTAGGWSDWVPNTSDRIQPKVLLDIIERMLQKDPGVRPKAAELSESLGVNPCCNQGREPYVMGDR